MSDTPAWWTAALTAEDQEWARQEAAGIKHVTVAEYTALWNANMDAPHDTELANKGYTSLIVDGTTYVVKGQR